MPIIQKMLTVILFLMIGQSLYAASVDNRKITGITNIKGDVTINAVDAATGGDLVQYSFDSKDASIGGSGMYSQLLTAFTMGKPIKIYYENTTELIGVAFFE